MRFASFLSCVALVATTSATPSQQSAIDITAVRGAIERELKGAAVGAATYAVVAGDAIAVGAIGLPADAQLQVGSINKLMTALALVATLEARKIPVSDAVGKHVAGLSSRLSVVTFHQLLSQTSGLRDEPGGEGTSDEGALARRVRSINDSDFVLPSGAVFSYSNLGYATAGFALEQLQQQPFADALRTSVFHPLSMTGSTMRPGEVKVRPATFDLDTSLWPAGYLWTTAADMARVLRLLIRSDTSSAALSSTVGPVTRAHAPMPNVFVNGHYGYGLMLAQDRGVRIYEHGGTQRGYSSILRVAPDQGLGVAILTNADNAPLRRVALAVMAEALKLPALQPPARNETFLAADEMKSFIGVYRNRGTAEIAIHDGRVVLMLDGGSPMSVSRIGEHRYLARPKPEVAGPEFVLQPATASAPAYLHFALWAYAR